MKTPKTLLDNGIVVRVSEKEEMYLVQRGKLHLIPSIRVYQSLYAGKDVVKEISMEQFSNVCIGQPLSEDTRLIKATGDAIYFNTNNTKSHIRSCNDFNLAGFDWHSVKNISDDEINNIETIRDFVIEQNKVIAIDGNSIPEFYNQQMQNVDYGALKMHEKFVPGNVARTASILLPPRYNPNEKYPILFLYHGLGGTSEEWINYRAQFIIGNLIHEDKMQSCITVIPDIFLSSDDQEQRRKKYREYRKILVEELLPYMMVTYSVKDGGENTAIGGLSMGGYAVLYHDWLCYSVRGLDTFHYVGAFGPSQALLMLVGDPDKFILPNSPECFTFISRGTNDSIVDQGAKLYSDTLTKNGVDNVYVEYMNGGHDGATMSRLLYQFLSYDFFRKK
ncbi:alpha/beta hydrolase [Bacteroides timonensis]|uniref:alpha/beta hydrolase n=1 Tax=Bacteroides timonensis TaxID=1470345 RepID=UPI0005C7117F|nr:alpha/beta hydrolase-fold protein [Bacteroides timonensis]